MNWNISRLIIWLAVWVGVTLEVRAQVQPQNYYIFHVRSGPYGVPGVSGTLTEMQHRTSTGYVLFTFNFTTDANGDATVTSSWFQADVDQINWQYEFPAAGGFTFDPRTASESGFLFRSGNNSFTVTITNNVLSGPLTGRVVSGGAPINGVSVTGSASGTVSGDTNGNFSLGNAAAQSVTASKSGVVFPSAQAIYPGHPVTIGAISGPISGVVSGLGNNAVTLTIPGFCSFASDSTGNGLFTSCSLLATQAQFTVVPSKFGYHFVPASAAAPAGWSGMHFNIVSTPPPPLAR